MIKNRNTDWLNLLINEKKQETFKISPNVFLKKNKNTIIAQVFNWFEKISLELIFQ